MKLCCVFNYNPFYRLPIYSEMDRRLDCDFYFGDGVGSTLQQFDPKLLRGFRGMMHVSPPLFKGYKWSSHIFPIFRRRCDAYLITGQIDYFVNWLIIVWAFITRRKLYCWSHGASSSDLHSRGARFVFRTFFRSMDGIFLYNTSRAERLCSLGVRKERIHTIYNSLDTALHTSIYDHITLSDIYVRHFGNPLPTVIYIGRLQRRKRLDLLIEAVASINADAPRVNLVIVGADDGDNTIASLTAQHHMEGSVWFYGPCFDEPTNAELLYNAALCVCPAEVGLTAIHALSYGTPVVTNDDFESQMPEYEAIEDGTTGSFYKKDDTASLAQHIIRWTSLTPPEREATRQAARANILRHWSVDYQIGLLQQFFSPTSTSGQ